MKYFTKKQILEYIRIFLIVVACILINYGGKMLTGILEFPLWLDSLGTALCAYIYGPVCGAIVGVSVNFMYGMQDSMVYVYSIVNLATGIIIGLTAKKGMMESFFEASKVAAIVTIVATAISTPLNLFFYGGVMGNKWGDAITDLLKHHGVALKIASLIGEFFIDFADKIFTMLFLYVFIRIVRFIRKKEKKEVKKQRVSAAVTLVCLLTVLTTTCLPAIPVYAANVDGTLDYSSYIQTVYNNSNGLACGEANDIVATNDGVLWIATYAGLYRYSGSEFQYMDKFQSIKNANDLYVDEEGRLWVGTNDMGLSICSKEEISNVLDMKSGLPSNSVRSIVRNSEGDYLVGTSSGLAIVSLLGGINTKQVIDEIQYAQSLSSDMQGHTAAVTSKGQLYLLKGTEIVDFIQHQNEYCTSCRYNRDGSLYVTTDTGMVYIYNTDADKLRQKEKIEITGFTELNNSYEMEDGTVFLCSDYGVCYLDEKHHPHAIATGTFNSSIDNMTVDYQGNIWFCSTRQGLLKLCASAFSEVYSIVNADEKVVNTVAKWQKKIYCGTDKGLDIFDELTNEVIKDDELIDIFAGVRIRNIFVDSKNRMWISSYIGEILRIEENGAITRLGANEGIIGAKFRQTLELQDGTVAIASELGVSVVDNDKVLYTVGTKEGLAIPIVLCMNQAQDGAILAGTDGGGIAIIKQGKVEETFAYDELGSGVVLRIVKDRDNDGLFIVTSNGVCYLTADKNITRLSTFPYSNNYDIYDNGKGLLFVTGSAGIYVVNKEELLSGGPVNYEQLNYMNGLRQTFTANAWNSVIDDEIWYICNNSGVTRLDLCRYNQGIRSFRLIINSMVIDGVTHMVDRSEPIVIPSENNTLELKPEIINYTSEDPIVRYYMEGYDREPIDIKQSVLRKVIYKGMPSGTYKFHLAVLDKNNKVVEEQIYTILREHEFYESKIVLMYFIIELILIIAWIAWVITRLSMQRALETKNREVEHALEQVRLGNETILTIAKTVDAKDENTSQHSFRVSEYSVLIGRKLGYNAEQCEDLRKSALLHDIGKIGIPDSVLNKPARLNDEEYEIMKSHVTRGGEILKNFTVIPHVQEGAMYHHERYDGKGYAQGLKGEEIPEFARIIGVADAFDAMTANRVYRRKLDPDFVIEELKRGRGTQFDPRMADIMLDLITNGEIDIEELYGSSQKEKSNE